jgi:hypothetical protein
MPQTIAKTPATESTAIIQKIIARTPSDPSLAIRYNGFVTHSGRHRNRVVVSCVKREDPMLRIYAVVSAAVLGVIAIAALVRIPSAGLGASVFYLGSAAIFAYAGFTRRECTIVRSVVAAMGSFFLLSGVLVALAMGILGFPFGGRGWEVGLVHAAVGGLTMACATLLPCDDEEEPASR